MGSLRKLPVSQKSCNQEPFEVYNYQSKNTFVVGEGSAATEVLTSAPGTALVSGDPLSFGGTIQNDGCLDIRVTVMNHFVSSGQCDECIPDVMDTKAVVLVIPKNYELDLSGYISSIMVETGSEDADGSFTPSDVITGEQVVRYNACFSSSCQGTKLVP